MARKPRVATEVEMAQRAGDRLRSISCESAYIETTRYETWYVVDLLSGDDTVSDRSTVFDWKPVQ